MNNAPPTYLLYFQHEIVISYTAAAAPILISRHAHSQVHITYFSMLVAPYIMNGDTYDAISSAPFRALIRDSKPPAGHAVVYDGLPASARHFRRVAGGLTFMAYH